MTAEESSSSQSSVDIRDGEKSGGRIPSTADVSNYSPGIDGESEHRPYFGLENDIQEQQHIQKLARTLTNLSMASRNSSGAHIPAGSHKAEDHDSIAEAAKSITNDTLQRSLSRASHTLEGGPVDVPFDENARELDPRLDPDSPEFDSKFWVQTMHHVFNSDPEYYKPMSLGVCLKDLRVSGVSNDADYQITVANVPLKVYEKVKSWVTKRDESRYFDILKPMDALFEPGRVCVVLGRPGAGCSTLLKTVSARTYGLTVRPESVISYDGIDQKTIVNHYRGDVIYSPEIDFHFANLTVGYTLEFAARCRCPSSRPAGISREQYYKHYAAVTMATYGLSHTYNTKVGDDYVRGVSGGERKRVSIAEVSLAGAKVQCWDNATRGLDSATALEFVRAMKTNASVTGTTPLIAIYQCSQDAYDLFDDVLVLYEGYEIFFGTADSAKDYFVDMGWECPPRQTTADFLTSITSPSERKPRPGFEKSVPRTAEEFYDRWRSSPEHAELRNRIDAYLNKHSNGQAAQTMHDHHTARQSKHSKPTSPFLISFGMQVKAVMDRNWQKIKGDPSVYCFNIISNCIMALIISSMFYNQKATTGSFYYRTSAMFTGLLFNSFSSLLEILALFEARNIVEKHKTYAFYRPSADALASIMTEMPSKFLIAVGFNLIYYFMINFRRSAGHFFFYFLIALTSMFAMSHLFRTIGSACISLQQAMIPASILLLILSIYVGFIIPKGNILGWSKWLYYLNPIARSMEAMVANEFAGREFECSQFVPSGGDYDKLPLQNKICSVVGSEPGKAMVSGTKYMRLSFDYRNGHRWRNWGIVVCYAAFFLGTYLLLIEYNKGEMQKGEMTIFPRSTLKKLKKKQGLKNDIESNDSLLKDETVADSHDEKSHSSSGDRAIEGIGSDQVVFWRNICYDVQIKTETRRILSNIDGWVKPGTLTALMGSSGAGKTTLLDTLANRVTTGVITGDVFVNGRPTDESFQRSTGYCQQQDLHGRTQTVREALTFSAYLRQPYKVPKKEKDEYVEKIIDLLEMRSYADALVGVTGEGLNVEQRKRLTIGVELVAKPKLLLFLDEPTSGLDSQTAWSVCQLMRKLASHGQAILCTIHQPSAILMQEFDRLLLLQKGGRTVYFGELGKGCSKMIEYFESKGSEKFPPDCNPAEFMLHVIGAAPGSHVTTDYHQVWLESQEYQDVQKELGELMKRANQPIEDNDEDLHKEFATPFWYQLMIMTKRVLEQHWRSPGYIVAKLWTVAFSGNFIGFSFFKANNTLQGLQNQMFSLFMLMMIFNPLVQQMLPQYTDQRELFEVKERPSKTCDWKTFVLAQLLAELPWCLVTGSLAFFCFYYPVGLYRNCPDHYQLHERGALFWLICVSFTLFTTTFGQVCIAGLERRENAALVANTCFMMCISFCGVLVSKEHLPGFWKFMYYISPFTYLIAAMMATGISNTEVICAKKEYLHFPPPNGQTCGKYMKAYMEKAGGYLLDENSTTECTFCTMSQTNAYLKTLDIHYSQKWRNWVIFTCYSIFNVFLFVLLYWLFRVPRDHVFFKKLAGKKEEWVASRKKKKDAKDAANQV